MVNSPFNTNSFYTNSFYELDYISCRNLRSQLENNSGLSEKELFISVLFRTMCNKNKLFTHPTHLQSFSKARQAHEVSSFEVDLFLHHPHQRMKLQQRPKSPQINVFLFALVLRF